VIGGASGKLIKFQTTRLYYFLKQQQQQQQQQQQRLSKMNAFNNNTNTNSLNTAIEEDWSGSFDGIWEVDDTRASSSFTLKQQRQFTMATSPATVTSTTAAPRAALGDLDILCGRDKEAFRHVGNRRFRHVVKLNLVPYARAKGRQDKSAVILSVIEQVREMGGRFVKRKKGGRVLVELSDKQVREKVGHAIRDMATAQQMVQPAVASRRKSRVEHSRNVDYEQRRSFSSEPLKRLQFYPVPFAADELIDESENSESDVDFYHLAELFGSSNNINTAAAAPVDVPEFDLEPISLDDESLDVDFFEEAAALVPF